MEISEVRVRLVHDTNDRLKAVCIITLGSGFVVRDVKIVDGAHGLFVAMPSRKLTASCGQCRAQNHVRAKFCNECGKRLPPARVPTDDNGREKIHRDIAHPITPEFRQIVQDSVLEAYRLELENAPADADRSDDSQTREAAEVAEPSRRNERPSPEPESDFGVMDDPGNEAVSEDQPSEAEEAVAESANDYDSMIADLRGTRPARPVAVGDRSPRPKSNDRGDGDGRSRRGGRRSRGGRGRGGEADRTPSEKTDTPREETVTADASVAATAKTEVEQKAPIERPAAPVQRPEPSKRPAPTKRPATKKPAAKAPVVQPVPTTVLDDDAAFGAGMDEPVVKKPVRKTKSRRTKESGANDSGAAKDLGTNGGSADSAAPRPAPADAVDVLPVEDTATSDGNAYDDSSPFGAGLL